VGGSGLAVAFGFVMSPAAASAAAPPPATDPTVAEMADRVAELTRELAELRAQVDPTEPRPRAAVATEKAANSSPPDARPQPDRPALPDNVSAAPLDLALQDPRLLSALQLTGGTGDARAELLLQSVISRPGFAIDSSGAAEGRASMQTIALAASAPLGDGANTDLATLDGFADDFTVKFRFTSFNVRLRKPKDVSIEEDMLGRAQRECLRQNANAPDIEKICATNNDRNLLIRTYLPLEYPVLLQGRFPSGAASSLGFEAKLGYREFGFLDPAALVDAKAKRWSVRAKLFGAYYPTNGRTALTASAAWERGYAEAGEAAVCLGAVTPGICPLAIVGPPVREDRALFSLGLRSFVDTPGFIIPRIALAPSVNYEAKDDIWGFDLPLYLVTNGDRALTGGLRVGYIAKPGEDDLVFGLFVGAAFSLFQ
jgi:hypothetical protein